jgi:hypothetical protein
MQAPPSCEQLHQAFETLAVRDHNLARMGYAAAMQHPIWARVIDCKARAMRTAAYRATTSRRVRLVRRFNPSTGTWHTQRVAGAFDDSQPLIA